MSTSAQWGTPHKEQRMSLRGMVSHPRVRPAEIEITGFGGRSFSYLITFPGGRTAKRVGIPSLAQARGEAESIARLTLDFIATDGKADGP